MVSSIVWRQSVRVYKGHYYAVVTGVSLLSLLTSSNTLAVVYKRRHWRVTTKPSEFRHFAVVTLLRGFISVVSVE